MTTIPLHALGGLSVEEVSPGEFQLVVKASGLTIPDTVTISNEVEVKNDTGNPVPVSTPTPAAPVVGQVSVTASAVALPSRASVNGWSIKAPSTNTNVVYIGPAGITTATGYPLDPGEAVSIPVSNLSSISVVGTTGDALAYLGN